MESLPAVGIGNRSGCCDGFYGKPKQDILYGAEDTVKTVKMKVTM